MDHDETIVGMAYRLYPVVAGWDVVMQRIAFLKGAEEGAARALASLRVVPEDAEGEPEAREGALVEAIGSGVVRVMAVLSVGKDREFLEPMHPTGRDTGSGVIEMVTDPVSYSGVVVRIEVEHGQLRRSRTVDPWAVPMAQCFWHALTVGDVP